MPADAWRVRHRMIVRLLYAQAAGLFVFGVVRGFGLGHSFIESAPIALAAIVADHAPAGRSFRSSAATIGLVMSSAVMVHLSGGTIEAHFHFFVMVGVISLYQSWTPFLLALGFVILHHGAAGVLDPRSVYNHAAAWAHPWRWAAIHGAFVLAASAAQLVTWRFSEHARASFELILDSTAEGVIGVDGQGMVTFLNPAAARMLDIGEDDAIGRDALEVLGQTMSDGTPYPDDRCALCRTTQTKQPHQVDDVSVGPAHRPVEMIATPITRHGQMEGIVVTFRDVAERRAAEAERRVNLSLLEATLESTADGLLVVDGDGKITSLNQRFAEMWRIPEDVLASKDDEKALGFVLSQLTDPEVFLQKVRDLYADPSASSYDVLEFKDGRVFERYSQPQRVDGESVGRVWSFRDVTEQRKLDAMKDSFLSAVSHELRTPLTNVLGFTLTLQQRGDELDASERADMLARLGMNSRKLQRLLTDILDLDRLGRNILQPLRQPTDLTALTREIIDGNEGVRDRNVTLIDRAGVAHVDPAKVERIIENLLINAHRHTPADARLWVMFRREGDGLVIAVEDDGPGIDPADREEIFESFRQGANASTHSPGVGIGLSLVARFAELHGGRAWVEERAGGGASFRVYLADTKPPMTAQGHRETA